MNAKTKLKEEMDKANNPTITRIGEYLLGLLPSADVEECIMAEDKTIKGAYEDMRKKAQKKAVNRSACFTDEEGFEIVKKYYGIKPEKTRSITADDVDSFF